MTISKKTSAAPYPGFPEMTFPKAQYSMFHSSKDTTNGSRLRFKYLTRYGPS